MELFQFKAGVAGASPGVRPRSPRRGIPLAQRKKKGSHHGPQKALRWGHARSFPW